MRPRKSAVLALHPWWGLNGDIRAAVTRLEKLGFGVESPDLYDGRVATEIPAAEAMMKALDRVAARGKIDAAIDRLRQAGPVAVVGWSMGASYAWDLATRRPGIVTAIVSYYGGYDRDAPASLPPLLGHFAEHDEEAVEEVRDTEKRLVTAGRDVAFQIYPGTKHWFDEPSRPEYDQAASALAWSRTVAFLGERLG